MKVDYLSIHFKNSMIPSRTKHESFDSFGSHAQYKFPYLDCSCTEPILYSFVIFQNEIKISKEITNPRSKYSEDSSDQTKNM